jgi:hypothetical protein
MTLLEFEAVAKASEQENRLDGLDLQVVSVARLLVVPTL